MKTTEIVESLTKPVVEAMGYTLCDVEFVKEYGNWTLTLFIDKEGGINIDDCEAVSKAVEPVLDEADPIAQAYYLSVSSLGIDRPLKKDADYERSLNKELEVRTYAPIEGKKEFYGVLESYTPESFILRTEEKTLKFDRKDCALVRPHIDF